MDRDVFKAWLESKTPNEKVGIRHDDCNCPIASCFGCYVGHIKYRPIGKRDCVDLPRWAATFITRIDNARGAYSNIVFAAEAISILADIP